MLKTFGTAAALMISGAAFAETASLDFRGLDLTTEAGKAEMNRRIEVVARKACPAEALTGSRIPLIQHREECMADVRRQVQAKLAAKNRLAESRLADSAKPVPAPQP